MLKIHLKSHNGKYVCAEDGGGREIVANRDKPSIWETFKVYDNNGGTFISGDKVYLQAHNGQFVSCDGEGRRQLVANKSKASTWETFSIIKVNGVGEIKNGDKVCLQSYFDGYVSAEGGGGREVLVNIPHIDVWETFTIGFAEEGESILPITLKEYTKVGTAKHMETTVTLSEGGKIHAQTTTWTTSELKGWTGGVAILVLDSKGNILHQSKELHTFGVDGTMIFIGGPSKRTDFWQESMDPELAKKARKIQIYHIHAGKNRLLKIVKTAAEFVAELQKIGVV